MARERSNVTGDSKVFVLGYREGEASERNENKNIKNYQYPIYPFDCRPRPAASHFNLRCHKDRGRAHPTTTTGGSIITSKVNL
jgi:hypothetical protein